MTTAPPRNNGPLFAGLLATFVLLHHWKQLPLDEAAVVTAVRLTGCLAAMAVLARPDLLATLALLAGTQILGVLVLLPTMSNSWMAAGCLSVGVLGGALAATRLGQTTVSGAWPHVQPAVASVLLAFYVFAALCKFNLDFMDPGPSCAASFYRELARDLPLPSAPWAETAAIVGTLAIEAGIPLLLAFAPTRTTGIAVGLLFHAFIAVSPRVHIFDFSLLMYTGYVAFAPADLSERISTDPRLRVWRAVGEQRLWILAFILGIAVVAGFASPSTGWNASLLARAYVWDALALVFVSGGIYGMALTARPGPGSSLRSAQAALAVALVVLNGASPYVGLKTTVAFTMFSNLRTEQGFENHAFLPPLRIFPHQDDLIEVLSTDANGLEPDPGIRHVPFDLRVRLADQGDAHIHYRQAGSEYAGRVADDPRLGVPPHPLVARLMAFRPVEITARSCQW